MSEEAKGTGGTPETQDPKPGGTVKYKKGQSGSVETQFGGIRANPHGNGQKKGWKDPWSVIQDRMGMLMPSALAEELKLPFGLTYLEGMAMNYAARVVALEPAILEKFEKRTGLDVAQIAENHTNAIRAVIVHKGMEIIPVMPGINDDDEIVDAEFETTGEGNNGSDQIENGQPEEKAD